VGLLKAKAGALVAIMASAATAKTVFFKKFILESPNI
jgi:hypothetical protein